MPAVDDQINNALHAFERANKACLKQWQTEQQRIVRAPVYERKKFPLSTKDSFKVLMMCFQRGETEFKRLAERMPKDVWLSYLLRLPDSEDHALLGLITVGLTKHAPLRGSIAVMRFRSEDGSGLAMDVAESGFQLIFRLWFTAEAMIEAAQWRRTAACG
jgi:hypothetical protein